MQAGPDPIRNLVHSLLSIELPIYKLSMLKLTAENNTLIEIINEIQFGGTGVVSHNLSHLFPGSYQVILRSKNVTFVYRY